MESFLDREIDVVVDIVRAVANGLGGTNAAAMKRHHNTDNNNNGHPPTSTHSSLLPWKRRGSGSRILLPRGYCPLTSDQHTVLRLLGIWNECLCGLRCRVLEGIWLGREVKGWRQWRAGTIY